MILSFLTHEPESPHKIIPSIAGPAYFDGLTRFSPDDDWELDNTWIINQEIASFLTME